MQSIRQWMISIDNLGPEFDLYLSIGCGVIGLGCLLFWIWAILKY